MKFVGQFFKLLLLQTLLFHVSHIFASSTAAEMPSRQDLDPLISEFFQAVDKNYKAFCQDTICEKDDFKRQLPSLDKELRRPWLKIWDELKSEKPDVRARRWIVEIYKSLINVAPDLKTAGPLVEATFVWLVLEKMMGILEIAEDHPARITLLSELQYRSLMALQLAEAWEIATQLKDGEEPRSLEHVRIQSGHAFMLLFFGHPTLAQISLENILKSEVLRAPAADPSLYLAEKAWAFKLLRDAVGQRQRPATAAVIEHIAPFKLVADPREQNLRWWWSEILKEKEQGKGPRRSLSIKDYGFFLKDDMTWHLWNFLEGCPGEPKVECKFSDAIARSEKALKNIVGFDVTPGF